MKIAVISDIHANLEALYAVKSDISDQKIETVYCLGDIVGYGPYPHECILVVRNMAAVVLLGNHDEAAMETGSLNGKMHEVAAQAMNITRELLTPEDKEFLKNLPKMRVVPELNLTLAHGSPAETWEYIIGDSTAKLALQATQSRIICVGHSHAPFIFGEQSRFCQMLQKGLLLEPDQRYVINVGSVGQPRDGDCRACYVVLDFSDAKLKVSFRRLSYDISKTAKEMEKWGFSPMLSMRLFIGR